MFQTLCTVCIKSALPVRNFCYETGYIKMYTFDFQRLPGLRSNLLEKHVGALDACGKPVLA